MGRQDRVKANPSPYPALVFHGLRTAQVISALVVTCVIAYFMRELKDAGYGMPWTFILVRLPHFSPSYLSLYPSHVLPVHPTIHFQLEVTTANVRVAVDYRHPNSRPPPGYVRFVSVDGIFAESGSQRDTQFDIVSPMGCSVWHAHEVLGSTSLVATVQQEHMGYGYGRHGLPPVQGAVQLLRTGCCSDDWCAGLGYLRAEK